MSNTLKRLEDLKNKRRDSLIAAKRVQEAGFYIEGFNTLAPHYAAAIDALKYYAGNSHSDIELEIWDMFTQVDSSTRHFDSDRLCKKARKALSDFDKLIGGVENDNRPSK